VPSLVAHIIGMGNYLLLDGLWNVILSRRPSSSASSAGIPAPIWRSIIFMMAGQALSFCQGRPDNRMIDPVDLDRLGHAGGLRLDDRHVHLDTSLC